jgi:hypothetical protein
VEMASTIGDAESTLSMEKGEVKKPSRAWVPWRRWVWLHDNLLHWSLRRDYPLHRTNSPLWLFLRRHWWQLPHL